jgi:hypothetical protein
MNDVVVVAKRLSSELDEISRTVRTLKKRMLSTEKLAATPRNFLWGIFEDFDAETQTIRVRIGSDLVFYPLSYYDGEWLPMPGQAIIVAMTRRGAPQRARLARSQVRGGGADVAVCAPRIIGFTRRGIAIPGAPVLQCRVEEYVPEERFVVVRNAAGKRWTMRLPERYASIYDPDLRHAQVLAFRVIDVPPTKYFIPLEPEQNTIPLNEPAGDPLPWQAFPVSP